MNDAVLITVGFPRSGNMYLNYSLRSLYFPNKDAKNPRHATISIKNFDHVIVPFRNPLDSMSSFLHMSQSTDFISMIKYYIRFTTYVLDNLNKTTLMNFDYFTKDLEYIKNKIYTGFSLDPVQNTEDSEIKMGILDDNKLHSLPRNNQEKLEIIKANLLEMPQLQECFELYNILKAVPDIA